MRHLTACLLACLAASPAAACYNDRSTGDTERKFRESYGEAPPSANALTARDAGAALGLGLLAAMGLAVVGGATAFVVISLQRKSAGAGRARQRLWARQRSAGAERPLPAADPSHPFAPPNR